MPLQPYSVGSTYSVIWLGKLSFASVLVLPISSALFYPPNPKATSTLSLPTSNRTAPYIFPYFPSLLQVTAKKIGGPATPTPRKSKRPHRFRAGTRALQEIQKYQKSSNLLVPAANFIREIEPIPSGNLPPGFDPVEGCKLIRKEKVLFSRFSLFFFSLYEAVRVHCNEYFIWSFNSLPLEGTFF
ncbi:hypothetical protein ES332_D01G113900v1 [Gossypium tomentosum]|uniref:Histone H2A/H2B/H3 domain-containing protein n=1 Tax=Gossypium tomentosum TaxID=34277 RepID=A0A5D2M7X1_GOSTO|nr:hypothetical protein ES332_D01G113900v1 [Gossypium tomentosum]